MENEEDFRDSRPSYSDDEEDTLHSYGSDEEDAFSPRLSSLETRPLPPPINTKLDDDGPFRRPGEDDTPRGVCSPLVQSFSLLSTRGVLSPTSSVEPGGFAPGEPATPLRGRRCQLPLTPLTSSQDLSFTKNRPPQVRTLYTREPKTTPKNASLISRLNVASPGDTARPKRTAVETSRHHEHETPLAFDFRTQPASAAMPPLPNKREVQGAAPAPAAAPVEHFNALPPRHHLSPPRAMKPGHNRRVSLERSDLMPSPIAQPNWASQTFNYSASTLAAISAVEPSPARQLPMMSPAPPAASEVTGNGAMTPSDDLKYKVAPSRPRKRSGAPTNPRRSIWPGSPMTHSSSGPVGIADIPDLEPAEEATECLITNGGADSVRSSKLVRRHSVLDDAPEVPTRTYSSPIAALRRTQSVPLPVRTLSDRPLKQTPEQERFERERCRVLTTAMARKGTKMLCLDWDLTVIGLHTESRWVGTAEQLSLWIRPVFRNFILAALHSKLRVAVVSFSGQTTHVHGAVRHAFGEDAFRSGQFVVRCSDKQWETEKTQFEALFPKASHNNAHKSKLHHICSAAAYFRSADKENSNPQTQSIRPENIVLIDDDLENVTDAYEHGVHSFTMDTASPAKFLDLLEDWCEGGRAQSPLSLHMGD